MTKRRVSAKQRLELIIEAYKQLNSEQIENISHYDMVEFVRSVDHALHAELTPRQEVSNDGDNSA